MEFTPYKRSSQGEQDCEILEMHVRLLKHFPESGLVRLVTSSDPPEIWIYMDCKVSDSGYRYMIAITSQTPKSSDSSRIISSLGARHS